MLLETQKNSIGSSSLYPVSGMTYIRSSDALVICLFDGSFHVIHGISIDPSYFPSSPSSPLTGANLSATARSIFSQVEIGDVRSTDVNRTSGMISYDNSSTVVWVHEYVNLTYFNQSLIDPRNTGLVDQQTLAISTRRNTTACLSLRRYGTTLVTMLSRMIFRLF
jgi:general transcription factor 3C polypeptide 4